MPMDCSFKPCLNNKLLALMASLDLGPAFDVVIIKFLLTR